MKKRRALGFNKLHSKIGNMDKKHLSAILVLVSVFLLTFCGKGEKTGISADEAVYERVEKGEVTKEEAEGYILPELTPTAQVLIRACDNFEREYPDDDRMPKVLTKEGETYFFFKHYDSALVAYMEVYDRFPDSEQYVTACENIAKIYFERGEYGESEKWYAITKEAARNFNKEELVARADSMEKASAFKKAEVIVGEEELAMTTGQPGEIEGEGEKPVKVIPADVREKFIKQAEEFLELADRSKGEELGKRSLGKAAEAYEKVEEWEKAAEVYLKFAKDYPEDEKTMNAWFTAGERYEQAEKWQRAAEIYYKIYNLYPYEQFPDTEEGNVKKSLVIESLYRAGINYEKIENWDKVVECMKEYGNTPSKDAEKLVKAAYKVAIAYENMNRHSDAIEAYKTCVGVYKFASEHGFDVTEVSDLPAKSLLAISQDLYEEYDAIDFHLPEKAMQASFNKKLELAQKLNSYYEGMMNYNIPEFTTAAMYMTGKVYEEFADTWRDSERPSFPNFHQEAQYVAILLDNTVPFFEKTVNYYDQVIAYARREGIENEWVEKAENKLLESLFKWAEISEECAKAYEKAITPPGMTTDEVIDYQTKLGDYLDEFFIKKDQYDQMAETLYKKVGEVADSYGLESEWVYKSKERLIKLRPAMYAAGMDYTGKNVVTDWGWKVTTSPPSDWNIPPTDPFNWVADNWDSVSKGMIREKDKLKIVGFKGLSGAMFVWDKATIDMPPPSPIYIVKRLTLHKKPKPHYIYISACESYTLYVNGNIVGQDDKWKTVENYDITPYLMVGDNIIGIEARSDEKDKYWVKAEIVEEGAIETYRAPEPQHEMEATHYEEEYGEFGEEGMGEETLKEEGVEMEGEPETGVETETATENNSGESSTEGGQ